MMHTKSGKIIFPQKYEETVMEQAASGFDAGDRWLSAASISPGTSVTRLMFNLP